MADFETLVDDAYRARAEGRALPSPCVNICRIDPQTGWCEGCFRRLEEIGGWGSRDESAKWTVWQNLVQRRQKFLSPALGVLAAPTE